MSITAAELLAKNCLNRPEDDTSTGGGAIDPDVRPDFTQLAANDDLEVLSDNAGDTTQIITVDGRNDTGAFVTATATLNGTTAVILSPATTYERGLSGILDSDGVGIITLRRSVAGATVYAIPIGERGFSGMFLRSASESGATTRYDKMHWLNDNATLTLNLAKVQLTADPSSKIRQGVHTAKDDSATITNRETAPGGVTFVDDSVQQSVPGNTLEAASAIGVWIEMQLTADDSPVRSTFTTELAGTTV